VSSTKLVTSQWCMASIDPARARASLRALVTSTATAVLAYAEEVSPAEVCEDVGRDLRVIAAHRPRPSCGPAPRNVERLERALKVLEREVTSASLAAAVIVLKRLAGGPAADADTAAARGHDDSDVASLAAAAFDGDAAAQDAFRRAYRGKAPSASWRTVDAVRNFMQRVAAARRAVENLRDEDDAADEVRLRAAEPDSAAGGAG
jgi:hypothetical protein